MANPVLEGVDVVVDDEPLELAVDEVVDEDPDPVVTGPGSLLLTLTTSLLLTTSSL